jgi:hypothetical protein
MICFISVSETTLKIDIGQKYVTEKALSSQIVLAF